jgi:hypothetical protein
MTDLELKLTAAMHELVDGHQAPPDMADRVLQLHRRRSGLAAAVAVGAALLILAALVPALAPGGAGQHDSGPGSRHTARPSPHRTGHHHHDAAPRLQRPRQVQARLRGVPMPSASRLRLLLSGTRPAWMSLPSGQLQPIAGLAANKGNFAFTRVVGGWSVYPFPPGPVCQPDCAGPAHLNYYLPGGASAATPIGRGYGVYASNGPGAVWLVRYPRARSSLDYGRAIAQEVTLSGQRLGSPQRMPAGYTLVRAAGPYLVLTPYSQGPGTVEDKLWDTRTRHVARTLPDVIAVGPEQIAWGPICGGCSVHLLDLATGVGVDVPLPHLTWAYNGTYTADGRYLALQLSTSRTSYGMALWTQVAVIDTATGHLTVLAGTAESPNARNQWQFGWQAGSDELVIAMPGRQDRFQIATWRPGQARLRVAATRIPRGMYPVLGEDD